MTILQQLTRRCRRADKDGLSVSTLERMMADVSGEETSTAPSQPQAVATGEPTSADPEVPE